MVCMHNLIKFGPVVWAIEHLCGKKWMGILKFKYACSHDCMISVVHDNMMAMVASTAKGDGKNGGTEW